MQLSAFTALPAEVRNVIYSFCTPFNGHMEDFKGLLLASKQIRSEFESEAVVVMAKYTRSIEHDWPHAEKLRIDRPTKLPDLTSITIRLPVSLYYPPLHASPDERDRYYGGSTRLEPCLTSLFSLHLSKLTFACYDNRADDQSSLGDLPIGFLYDLTNTLITPSALRICQQECRTRRTFRMLRRPRVRKLCYRWCQYEQSSGRVRLGIESQHKRFFLNEPIWWEVPNLQTYVSNWGSSSQDEVFFDIEDEPEG